MVARTLWFWLCVGWLTEAIINPGTASICDLGPCRCTRGLLVCDCSTSVVKDVTLKEELFDSFTFSSISVTNCSHVHVTSGALSGLPALQQVRIANISKLTLEERSFSWTTDNPRHNGLLVNISDCVVPEIPSYCFQGSLRDIMLSSLNISRIRAYAFAAIDHADKIQFTGVTIADLESQSFKKFSVNFLTFSDSRVALFPARTMMDINVHEEARLDNVKVNKIESVAFKINESKFFRIVQCTIDHTEEHAFLVNSKGDLSIHDNTFLRLEKGAFVGFTVDRRYLQEAGKQDLVFENNTLENFESGSLTFNTTGFHPRLDWIMINQQCSCDSADSWAGDLVLFSSDPSFKTPAPQVTTVIFCLNPKFTNVRDYQRLYCNVTKSSLFVKVVVIAGVVLALSTLIILVYRSVKKRGKRYINVPTSPSALKPADSSKAHMLVVPDGKTYRETELHVIVEHAESIIPTEYVKERPDRNDNHQ